MLNSSQTGLTRKRARLDIAGRNDVYSTPQLYTLRPSESTILMETGGEAVSQTNSLFTGKNENLQLLGALSGASTLQYDDFFWMDDMFTFHPRNCMMGIFISSWWKSNPDDTHGFLNTQIIPITIPWCKLSLGGEDNSEDPQNAGTNVEGRSSIERLRDQLAYGLNLFFARYTNAKQFPNGWCLSNVLFDAPADNQNDFPIFQTAQLPPLKWVILHGDTLALVRNGDFGDGGPYTNYHFLFRLITIQPDWLQGDNFYNRILTIKKAPYAGHAQGSNRPNTILSMFGNQNGWMGYSPNVTGFGDFSTVAGETYTDGLTPAQRNSAFAITNWVNAGYAGGPGFLHYDYGFWQNYILTACPGAAEYCVVAPRMCSLCPSRYYSVQSRTFTRNQKRPIVSNIPQLASTDVLGLIFPQNGKNSSGNFVQAYFGPSDINTNPVIDLRPDDPKNNVDLTVYDERESFARNNNYNVTQPSYDMPGCVSEWNLWWAAQEQVNFTGAVPNAAYAPWNPDTVANPNNECMLTFQNISQSPFFCLYDVGHFVTKNDITFFQSIVNPLFNILCKPASWLIHFTRVLGEV
jgi:hypothetical protein